jgi:hypothetical protein
MYKKVSTIIIIMISATAAVFSQSFYFGPKAGPALNFQRWNEFENSPMLSINGDIFIESAPEDEKNYMYASVGYRTRGSSWQFGGTNAFDINGNAFRFRNAVLEVGVKRMINESSASRPYYFFGLRGEYNISTNLKEYEQYDTRFYPHNAFVKKIVYGASVGGGYEYPLGDLVKGFVEIGLHPDLNQQYFQPAIPNVPHPFNPGTTTTLQERQINNVSMEIKVGLKFLRKVIYE